MTNQNNKIIEEFRAGFPVLTKNGWQDKDRQVRNYCEDFILKALQSQQKNIIEMFDRKMLKTKGENPDVACLREGYNMRIKEEWEKEYKGQFPSKNCECHFQEPYGFVPEAGCLEHDTKQFSDFISKLIQKAREEGIKEGIKIMLNNCPGIMKKWRKYYGEKSLGEFILEKLKKKI